MKLENCYLDLPRTLTAMIATFGSLAEYSGRGRMRQWSMAGLTIKQNKHVLILWFIMVYILVYIYIYGGGGGAPKSFKCLGPL